MKKIILIGFVLLALAAPALAIDFTATFLLASYEPSEVNDLEVSPDTYWSPTLDVNWPVRGGVNGMPEATEGNYVLRLQWATNPTGRIQVRHNWKYKRFDLDDVNFIHIDVYIATESAIPEVMGIWDSNWLPYQWFQAACVPRWTNQWYTICIPVPDTNNVNLDHIEAIVFEYLAGTGENGTIYVDNLRLGPPDCSCGRIIRFSEYYWLVKKRDYDRIEPGPNYFTDGPNDVWVDPNGYLHLKIAQKEGKWYCSEVIADASLGYGTYIFTVQGRPDLLDPNIILGLFTYDEPVSPDQHREIDVEISRWPAWREPPGDVNDVNNAQYVVMPDKPEHKHRFYINECNTTTHVFNWQPDRICFWSYYGDFSLAPPKEDIIECWAYTGSDIPLPGVENPRINFYLGSGCPPLNGQDAEIVIKSFQYLPDAIPSPCCPLCVLAPNGGENWASEIIRNIRWETYCDANIPNMMIEYSDNNSLSWILIEPNTENVGEYPWLVPDVNSNQCLIRVSDVSDPNIFDTSDDLFTIFPCLILITGDLNQDCYVDFRDFAIFAQHWLECGNPFDAHCQP